MIKVMKEASDNNTRVNNFCKALYNWCLAEGSNKRYQALDAVLKSCNETDKVSYLDYHKVAAIARQYNDTTYWQDLFSVSNWEDFIENIMVESGIIDPPEEPEPEETSWM